MPTIKCIKVYVILIQCCIQMEIIIAMYQALMNRFNYVQSFNEKTWKKQERMVQKKMIENYGVE